MVTCAQIGILNGLELKCISEKKKRANFKQTMTLQETIILTLANGTFMNYLSIRINPPYLATITYWLCCFFFLWFVGCKFPNPRLVWNASMMSKRIMWSIPNFSNFHNRSKSLCDDVNVFWGMCVSNVACGRFLCVCVMHLCVNFQMMLC